MKIVIVGGGKVGFHLARLLLEERHDIVVVEKDATTCKELAKELNCVIKQGNGTKPSVLEDAGAKTADALVSLTHFDETNMIVCLVAKQLGVKTVACRLADVHYDEELLQRLGLDLVIYPEAAAAGYIGELLTKPEVLDLAFIARGEAEVMEINVPAESDLVGKMIQEVEQPKGTAIIALSKKGKLVIPEPTTRIKDNDNLFVIAKRGRMDTVKKMLGLE